jgi:hypothetical protein
MSQWETCVLTGVWGSQEHGFRTTRIRLYHFSAEGLELAKEVKGTFIDGRAEKDAAAQIIAELGNDGWELVGVGDGSCLWFKRPKP